MSPGKNTAAVGQGPHDADEPLDVAGYKHGRRGAGAPVCGGGDEMSPGTSTSARVKDQYLIRGVRVLA